MSRRRVAVTGLGMICANGDDVATAWPALLAGRCGIGPIRTVDTARIGSRTAGEVQGFDPLAHFPAKRVNVLDRSAQFAVVAAREAMADAGLAALPPGPRSERCGAILGGPVGQVTMDAAYAQFYGAGSDRVHPFTVPRLMPSASASQVSADLGLRGPSYAVASACASAAHAIGQAFHAVANGMLDLAVTGGSDAPLVPGVLRAWESLRVLSPDVCRPFSRNRPGLVLGEGAGMLVLEPWDDAVARGARIHGEIAGVGMSADAADLTAPDAAGAARAMRAALADAGEDPEAVGYVNAHGTGTRLNDLTESEALRLVFGDRLPHLPVSSTKSMIGHTLCAGGAIEAVATLLALRDGLLPPTANFTEPDPDCPVDCIPDGPRPTHARLALSNSFAFGGLNAVLALRKA